MHICYKFFPIYISSFWFNCPIFLFISLFWLFLFYLARNIVHTDTSVISFVTYRFLKADFLRGSGKLDVVAISMK